MCVSYKRANSAIVEEVVCRIGQCVNPFAASRLVASDSTSCKATSTYTCRELTPGNEDPGSDSFDLTFNAPTRPRCPPNSKHARLGCTSGLRRDRALTFTMALNRKYAALPDLVRSRVKHAAAYRLTRPGLCARYLRDPRADR